jgi:uncharacterized cupin superfamily protein
MKVKICKAEEQQIRELGARNWPIWEKEVSEFDWHYDQQETCLILEGEVKVSWDNGKNAVEFQAGDLVIFPAGLSCRWEIKKAVRKHYRFA